MLALNLEDRTLAGIAAFYAIVNLSEESLPLVFREMQRVLQPGGLLLLAFHTGDEILRVQELWGQPISLDFFFFQPSASIVPNEGTWGDIQHTVIRVEFLDGGAALRRVTLSKNFLKVTEQ